MAAATTTMTNTTIACAISTANARSVATVGLDTKDDVPSGQET